MKSSRTKTKHVCGRHAGRHRGYYLFIHPTVTNVFRRSACDKCYLTLVLLNPDIPCLCKQCSSRSVGFFRSQLIWSCTVCHYVCNSIPTIWIKQSDWLKIRSGRGILIYSAWQGLTDPRDTITGTLCRLDQTTVMLKPGFIKQWPFIEHFFEVTEIMAKIRKIHCCHQIVLTQVFV